jgi:hypothetical protein
MGYVGIPCDHVSAAPPPPTIVMKFRGLTAPLKASVSRLTHHLRLCCQSKIGLPRATDELIKVVRWYLR